MVKFVALKAFDIDQLDFAPLINNSTIDVLTSLRVNPFIAGMRCRDDSFIIGEGAFLRMGGNLNFGNSKLTGTVKALEFGDTEVAWTLSGISYKAARFMDVIKTNLNSADEKLLFAKFFSGNDSIILSSDNDSMRGYAGNDAMFGNAGADSLSGDAGSDTIFGGEGSDTLKGDTGNDKLFGDDGDDFLFGGDGKDTLHGGAGRDMLTGGTGKDRFVFAALDQMPKATDLDTITDFQTGDRIDLSALDANVLKSGDQAFKFIGVTAFTAAGQLRFQNGVLSGDVNGDGIADFQIAITGPTSLVVKDFVL